MSHSYESAMDWARDYAVVKERELKQVFSFDPQPTTVVRLLEGDEVSLRLQFLCRALQCCTSTAH